MLTTLSDTRSGESAFSSHETLVKETTISSSRPREEGTGPHHPSLLLRRVQEAEEVATQAQTIQQQTQTQLFQAQDRIRALERRGSQQARELEAAHETLTAIGLSSSNHGQRSDFSDKTTSSSSSIQHHELRTENTRLTKELATLCSTTLPTLKEELATLQTRHESLLQSHHSLKTLYEQQIDEHRLLQEECVELREAWTLLSEVQASLVERNATVSELEWEVDRGREEIASLQAQIRLLSPTSEEHASSGDATEVSKSLFGEVEDRRVLAEQRHRALAQKHAALVKTHQISIHAQERMRAHISRLTRLSASGGGGSAAHSERINGLEQALAASQIENKDLLRRLAALERSQSVSASSVAYYPSTSRGGEEDEHHGEQHVELIPGAFNQVEESEAVSHLQSRLKQALTEQGRLSKELRAAQLHRLHEAERLRRAESDSWSARNEAEEARLLSVQLKFKLEEMEHSLKFSLDKPGPELEHETTSSVIPVVNTLNVAQIPSNKASSTTVSEVEESNILLSSPEQIAACVKPSPASKLLIRSPLPYPSGHSKKPALKQEGNHVVHAQDCKQQ